MLWRRHSKLLTVDELVCLTGPAAALVDRPARLGQPVGTEPFGFHRGRVTPTLGPVGTDAVAGLAHRVAKGVVRPHRRTLRRFANLVATGTPMSFDVTVDALCLLAYDRWQAVHTGEIPAADRAATIAAAEEFTVAALTLRRQLFDVAAGSRTGTH